MLEVSQVIYFDFDFLNTDFIGVPVCLRLIYASMFTYNNIFN